jgi:hypothetical protein
MYVGTTLVVSYSEHVCCVLRFMATHVKSSSLSQEEGVNDPLLKMFRRKKSLSRWVQVPLGTECRKVRASFQKERKRSVLLSWEVDPVLAKREVRNPVVWS